MSFPRYPAYKDSGVVWLGEVPQHWEVKPLKRVAEIQTGLAKGKEVEPEGSVEVPFLRVANVQDNFLDLENVHMITIQESSLSRYLLRPGDVLMNEGGDFDKLGRGCIWDGMINPCIHQNHVFAVRPHSIRPSWLNAYTSSKQANSYFISRSKQSTNLASISSSNLMDLLVPIAPNSETEEILSFLDRETTKIDTLIAEQQRLIELLQEKRQAVISHAVTKGLNPTAPMKDSGVEWLGEVPEHWKIIPLKNLIQRGTSISYGIVQPGEPLEEGIPFVQTTNMSRGDFTLESLQRTTPEIASNYPRSSLTGGEVLLGIRASIGATHIAPDWLAGANLSRGVARIMPSREILNSLLMLCLKSEATLKYWQLAKQGSTFNEVSIDTVKNLKVCVPPHDEQSTICAYAEEESNRYEVMLSQSKDLISLLQERRSALISAAVTGQIDVRGLVPEVEQQ
jgi:type I restriction enzyme S subunit